MELSSVAKVRSVRYYPTLQIVKVGHNSVELNAYDENGAGSHLLRSKDEAGKHVERWLETGRLT
jgi:hypothetical protein